MYIIYIYICMAPYVHMLYVSASESAYIYIYICQNIYICLLCIEVHTYIYNYMYLLYPSVAPRFDQSPPVSVATSRQLPHPAEIDRASSRRSPSPAGNWPPGDHFTRKKCWEHGDFTIKQYRYGTIMISPKNRGRSEI